MHRCAVIFLADGARLRTTLHAPVDNACFGYGAGRVPRHGTPERVAPKTWAGGILKDLRRRCATLAQIRSSEQLRKIRMATPFGLRAFCRPRDIALEQILTTVATTTTAYIPGLLCGAASN